MVSCGQSGKSEAMRNRQNEQKKLEAIERVSQICDRAVVNQGGIKSILEFSKKASTNFETFVYLAEMANEFGYHTEAFVSIAQYASQAKVETGYFKQLADISVMKLSETNKIEALAGEIAKLKTSTSPEIEKAMQELEGTANFKTLDEAKAYNKNNQ
jgi:hypothetical protein